MKYFQHLTCAKGIIGITTVLVVGIFSFGLALASMATAFSQLKTTRDASHALASFHASEGNVREAAYQYIHNTSYAGTDIPPLLNKSLDGELLLDSGSWPFVYIKSVAENNLTQHTLLQSINVFPESEAFNHAIYSNNTVDLRGNTLINGNIFANNSLSFTGNSSNVDGNVYSSGTIEDSGNISGVAFEGVNAIPPPIVDFVPYKVEAQNEGHFYTDHHLAENFLKNKLRSAHIYVESSSAETKISGNNTNLHGSLVVDGDLELAGGTFTAGANRVAIMVNGNLHVAGGTTINGVVYVKGSTTFGAGNNTINGSLITTSATMNSSFGGSTIINYVPYDWQNIEGLQTTSTHPPMVSGWVAE